MSNKISRRDFVRATAAAGAAATLPTIAYGNTPEILVRQTVKPVVISDHSGIQFKNGGPMNAVEKAFSMIVAGSDVLDALVAGVNIPELDPEETGIGYGGLPNADGIVQLDSCCMHGPKKWAGGVAALEGVRTPSLVAKAVMEYTDHHLLVGKGAQEFARNMGFKIEDDLNTDRSRQLWVEWRRRMDPEHWLDPKTRLPGRGGGAGGEGANRITSREYSAKAYTVGMQMVKEGLIPESSFWGTINCDGISPRGEICGVTTTSGLAWKIPGRAGDSPILGAGLYVDNDVGAAGSTGRGEANLYNLSSYLIVENMRRGLSPKDAGLEALRRIKNNTIEPRLRNSRGDPNFNIRFFVLNKRGEHAGVAMYSAGETTYSVCDENGARSVPLEPLLAGAPAE